MSNKPTCISLFTGVGGFDKGAKKAGFQTIYQSDIWPVAKKIFENNLSGKSSFPDNDFRTTEGLFEVADVKHVTAESIHKFIEENGKDWPEKLYLLITGSVCQNISAINPNRNNFNSKNRLMLHQLRLIDELKPMVALCEQVTGLNHSVMNPLRNLIEAKLNSMTDYNWDVKVLNAKDFGSNQERYRVIYMLVRKDVGMPSFPTPQPVNENKYLHRMFPEYAYFSDGKKDAVLKTTYRNFFYTMTAQGKYFFYDKEKNRTPLTIEQRIKLSELEGYNFEGIKNKDIEVLLGNMVQISFAEALCKHVKSNILKLP